MEPTTTSPADPAPEGPSSFGTTAESRQPTPAGATLRLDGIVKRYAGVTALKGVSFSVMPGEVHALVGENGAGKSTLVGVAAGSIRPDAGTVEIGGVEVQRLTPALAQELGLGLVYQHTSIIEDLTVAESLALAMPRRQRPSGLRMVGWAREQLRGSAVSIDPSVRVDALGVAERQLVEIAKALALRPRVLVLDEPTESLTLVESERLFERIKQITAAGTSVVYISHRLPEVKQVADRLTVLRDGEARGTFAVSDVSEDEILGLIVGRAVEHAFPDKHQPSGRAAPPVLRLRGFSGRKFSDVSFDVRPAEIVGLAGVDGNGQREFLRALAGLEKSFGEVEINGRRTRLVSPSAASSAGLCYLTNDRQGEGLFMSLSVRENASMMALRKLAALGIVSRRREGAQVREQMGTLAIKAPSAETDVHTLSGGNQQKILFARSLMGEPAVLLADEPTRGVDAGARLEIYRLLRSTVDRGKAMVILSSDAIELSGICDRVFVFSRGIAVKELAADELSEASITGAALRSTAQSSVREQTKPSNQARLGRFLRGDYFPSVILAALILILGIYTSGQSSFFLSTRSVTNILLLASTLAFIALGQLMVTLIAGIDLSVGPLAGFTVVLLSFFAGGGQSSATLVLGIIVVLLAGTAVGIINATMVRALKLTSVVVTISIYLILQGISLLLRPIPAGSYSESFVNGMQTTVGPIPVVFIVVVVLAVGLELALRFTRWGLTIRAIGSDETRAHRLGVSVGRGMLISFVACSLLAVISGLTLAAQVGIGDPNVGVNYTLTSITAVVLGGASIFGGRGSFIGVLFGAILLQEAVSALTFLNLSAQWQLWLPGGLILVGGAIYARTRVRRVS